MECWIVYFFRVFPPIFSFKLSLVCHWEKPHTHKFSFILDVCNYHCSALLCFCGTIYLNLAGLKLCQVLAFTNRLDNFTSISTNQRINHTLLWVAYPNLSFFPYST